MTKDKKLSIDEVRSQVLTAIQNDVVRFKYSVGGVEYDFELKNPPVHLSNDILNFNISSDNLATYIIENLLCEGKKFFRPSDIKDVKNSPVGSLVSSLIVEIHEHMVKMNDLKKK